MTSTPASPTTVSPTSDSPVAAPAMTDPRPAFAAATRWMTDLMAAVADDQLALPTPCTEFDVRTLMQHVVGTGMRAEAAGSGADVLSVHPVADVYSAAQYAAVIARAIDAWSDDARLAAPVRVPWGEVPGIGALWGYVNETLVHAWDLAVATGQPAETDPVLVESAFGFANRFIPAEIRGDDAIPFGPVVEPRPDAGAAERLANWCGRVSQPWVDAGRN